MSTNKEEDFLPLVSVIIPVFNGEADLPELIECLSQQSYSSELVEYLIIDNNSCDRTAEILATAVRQVKEKGINLSYLTEKEIQSSYAARNSGIRQSSHDLIAFTDADCRPQPDWLTNLIKPFIDSEVGIVVGEITALTGKSLIEKYSDLHQLMSQKFLLEHSFLPYGQTANLAIKKEAFVAAGLFRPHLTTGGDADICWRIQQLGWKLKYAPDAIVKHRHRSNLADFRSQFHRYGRSNFYLHQLHGVDLMRELTTKEIMYRLKRWLVKELPRDTIKLILGKACLVELIDTPIDLIGFHARTMGQKTARLSVEETQIEWL